MCGLYYRDDKGFIYHGSFLFFLSSVFVAGTVLAGAFCSSADSFFLVGRRFIVALCFFGDSSGFMEFDAGDILRLQACSY